MYRKQIWEQCLSDKIINCGLVRQICVCQPDVISWTMAGYVTCSAQSLYLNQCWLTVNWIPSSVKFKSTYQKVISRFLYVRPHPKPSVISLSTFPLFFSYFPYVSPTQRDFMLKTAQPFTQAQIKENIKAPRDWPLWGRLTGDRWIPRTKGQ